MNETNIQKAMALMANRSLQPNSINSGNRLNEANVEKAMALMAQQNGIEEPIQEEMVQTPETERGFFEQYARTNQALNSALAKGIISVADIPHVLASLSIMGGRALGLTERQPYSAEELPSHAIKGGLKNLGVDLEAVQPEGSLENIAAHGAEFLGGSLGGMGVGTPLKAALPAAAKYIPTAAKNIPYASKTIEKTAKAIPHILGAPDNAGQAAKMAALSGGVGLGGGYLQEEAGINPLVADITASAAVPAALTLPKLSAAILSKIKGGVGAAFSPKYRETQLNKAAEKEAAEFLQSKVKPENIPSVLQRLEEPISPIGYKGTVAERSGNIYLSKLQRAKNLDEIAEQQAIDNDAVKRALESVTPTEHNVYATKQHIREQERLLRESAERKLARAEEGVHKATEEFAHRASPEETGESIRSKLAENLKEHKTKRHEVTHPLYEKVKQIKEGVYPEKGLSLIKEELESSAGATEKSLLKYKKMLEKELPKEGAIPEYIKSPEMRKSIRKEMNVSEGPIPIKLKSIVGEISDEITVAKRTGDDNKARALLRLKKSLLEDLSVIPEQAQARKAYAELSQPIKEITKHRTLGKILKRDEFNKDYLIGEAEIPSKVINRSMASIKDSQALLKQVGHDEKVMKSIRGYINNDVINKITDDLGNVDVKKLETWKKANPAASLLYPNLDIKTKNLQNAKYFANEIQKENIKNVDLQLKEIFEDFTGRDLKKIVPSIVGSNNSVEKAKKIVDLTKSDKSGSALNGLRKAFVDDINSRTELSSFYKPGKEGSNVSYDKYRRYLQKNGDSMNEIFTKEQMKIFHEIEKAMISRTHISSVGSATGSPTESYKNMIKEIMTKKHKLLRNTFGKLKYGGETTNWILDLAEKAQLDVKNNLINKALVDEDMMKLLLTRVDDKKEVKRLIDALKEKSSLYGTSMRMDYGKDENE
jgi:hypothetical protein